MPVQNICKIVTINPLSLPIKVISKSVSVSGIYAHVFSHNYSKWKRNISGQYGGLNDEYCIIICRYIYMHKNICIIICIAEFEGKEV